MTKKQLTEAFHQLAKEALRAGIELQRLKAYEAKRRRMVQWFENWKGNS